MLEPEHLPTSKRTCTLSSDRSQRMSTYVCARLNGKCLSRGKEIRFEQIEQVRHCSRDDVKMLWIIGQHRFAYRSIAQFARFGILNELALNADCPKLLGHICDNMLMHVKHL